MVYTIKVETKWPDDKFIMLNGNGNVAICNNAAVINGFALTMRQVIIWTNDYIIYWHIYA